MTTRQTGQALHKPPPAGFLRQSVSRLIEHGRHEPLGPLAQPGSALVDGRARVRAQRRGGPLDPHMLRTSQIAAHARMRGGEAQRAHGRRAHRTLTGPQGDSDDTGRARYEQDPAAGGFRVTQAA